MQGWLQRETADVDEATDALGAMVAAVLDNHAAILDTLPHLRPSSMVYVKSSKATYSNTVATVIHQFVGLKFGKDVTNELKN